MISVIIPTYNRYNCLLNAIKSVQNQTYKDFEILVIDDQSTDKDYLMLNESFGIKLLRTKNEKGVCAARNLGIKESKGEYLAFLDDDDMWLPTKLEKQINTDSDFCYTESYTSKTDWVYDLSKIYQKYLSEKFKDVIQKKIGFEKLPDFITLDMVKKLNVLITSSVLVKKELVIEAGLFHRNPIYRWEDWSLWIKILEKTNCRFINEPLVFYNDCPKQKFSQTRK